VTTNDAAVFARLRAILEPYAKTLSVTSDTADCYCLAGKPGPATIKAWKGKVRKPMMPVAWVERGKSYVSYHVMALYGHAKLEAGLSKDLAARKQGKTCFNFKTNDEALFAELTRVTAQAMADFKKAGFV
jgi:hypothetical protein